MLGNTDHCHHGQHPHFWSWSVFCHVPLGMREKQQCIQHAICIHVIVFCYICLTTSAFTMIFKRVKCHLLLYICGPYVYIVCTCGSSPLLQHSQHTMALICIMEMCLGISCFVFICLANCIKMKTRRLRHFGILYLVLMTSVPPTKEARSVRRTVPANNLSSGQSFVDRAQNLVHSWCLKNEQPNSNRLYTYGVNCMLQCKAKYWRCSRKHYYQCNWHCKDIWEKSGARQWYRTCAAHFCIYCQEFANGFHLFCCIAVAPLLFFLTCCVSLSRCMLSKQWDFFRCVSEMIILCSLWQRWDTNAVAVGAWACWLMGLHCGRPFSCRAVTWVAVCLAQREVRIVKLVFLTILIYVAPLFGKRASTANCFKRPSKISRSTVAGVADLSHFFYTCAAAHLCSFIYYIA
jgi:hypothetical protein